MKVFLDTNVLIDYLLKREPFYGDAKKVFEMCLYKIDGFVTPHSLIDVFYMLRERTDAPAEYCRGTLLNLRSVLNVVGEDDTTVFAAARNTGEKITLLCPAPPLPASGRGHFLWNPCTKSRGML